MRGRGSETREGDIRITLARLGRRKKIIVERKRQVGETQAVGRYIGYRELIVRAEIERSGKARGVEPKRKAQRGGYRHTERNKLGNDPARGTPFSVLPQYHEPQPRNDQKRRKKRDVQS